MATPPPGQSFPLTSPAFAQQQPIPKKYSCDGQNTSPPLQWGEPPSGTKSLALIMDDPDAPGGTWVHWLLYKIPAAGRSLPEGVPTDGALPDGTRQGKNSWGNTGYGGPCPPSGTHRYFFRLYALDSELALPPGATKADLLKAVSGHVLGTAELMGTYRK